VHPITIRVILIGTNQVINYETIDSRELGIV